MIVLFQVFHQTKTQTQVEQTIHRFLAVQKHRMFVRSGNSLVGIVTVSDLLKAFASIE
jgi:CBS domain-containing protein